MSESDIAVRVSGLSKYFAIYDKPHHRLLQSLMPRLHRAASPLLRPFTGRAPAPRAYHREFWALRDVSFEVRRGETVGIIGRNGSGKSTLLQIVCGTLAPSGGRVEVNGRVAALLELGAGFNPEFTGRENVYMNATILGLSREEIDARYEDIVAFADIGEFITQPVKTYSSGMYVRLAFAVAASVDPDILIIDEALAVGDVRFQKKCINHLNALKDKGVSILFVSHGLEQVKRFCDRAIWLHRGEARRNGLAAHVCDEYEAYTETREEAHAPGVTAPSATTAAAGEQSDETMKLAKILGLRMDRNVLAPFEPLRVHLDYQVNEAELDSFLLGISIRRGSDDLYIFGPNTALDRVEVPSVRGRHRVQYEIPRLTLLGGEYYLEAGLFSDKGLVCLDFAPRAASFTVKAPYFSEGLVNFDHTWTVVPHD